MAHYRNIIYLALFLVFLSLLGITGSAVSPRDPVTIDLEARLTAPNSAHLLGTDELGRDIFSRVLKGFLNTIQVSIMCFVTSFFLGVLIGATAGYFYDTLIDKVFQWIAAMLFSLPFLLLIAACMSLMERNLFNAYVIITAIIWVGPARIVRTGVARAKSSDFVVAERAIGYSEISILFRSLIPMSIRPAFIYSFKYFPEIIGMEAGLSFLGLGIQPPHPGLGKMIFDGINYLGSAWWYAFFPALVLFITVCFSNAFFLWVSAEQRQGT